MPVPPIPNDGSFRDGLIVALHECSNAVLETLFDHLSDDAPEWSFVRRVEGIRADAVLEFIDQWEMRHG